jgi:diguanylate cyclase (GGDEF)-like protein
MTPDTAFAAGALTGAAVLCAATALSHLLLARMGRTRIRFMWPIAWLLLALGAGAELFNLGLPGAGARGIGGVLIVAGLLTTGLAVNWKEAGSKSDRGRLWKIVGAGGVLVVLAGLVPLASLVGERLAMKAGILLIGLGLLAAASVVAAVDVEITVLEGEIVELGETHQHLLRLAESDPLTGCPNRQALRAWFERWEGGESVSVVLIDISNLKGINDRHGKEAGDEALRLIARVLEESTRPGDLVVRWGGDEFVVILRGAGHEAAKRRFTSLIGTLEEAAEAFPYEAPLRVDWGVSSCVAASDISRSMAEADERMYAMKRRRRHEAGGAD